MGKKQTTKQIALEQAYKKELKRIKQFMRRAEKRGYRWYYYELPKKPKRITEKSVSRLKKITPDLLYKKGEYIDQETGEIIEGVKGRVTERKTAAQKAAKTLKQKKNILKKEKQNQKHLNLKPLSQFMMNHIMAKCMTIYLIILKWLSIMFTN